MESYSTSVGYATKGLVEPDSPPTAIQTANQALSMADGLANRISILTDRLCGSRPTEVGGTNGQNAAKQATFPALLDQSLSVISAVNAAHAALDRIESQI